ncbi:putative leucine-rich repeat-containing protein DDB_G0290503 [Crassostrea angulata]|uniref:putative leucine-rich repeat-containing protein DDB_G0290503 n=1 Tax=Magallana angulata TaxID=2784310 RepID=UPI0022B1EFAA|nr:putative leucine-rich repeat-containing protein DDB_G0290503 [Crassostrea angulata]
MLASGVSQQFQHGVDEEMINIITSIIIILTGYPPVNAEHVYNLLQYIYTFPHPYRTIREHTGGTLPIPLTVAASLPGWENVAPQQMNFMHAVFNHILEQDQKLVRDLFYRQLGRAPTVQEFAQFLLNFEGNELVESPRKTLGQTFFENQVLRVTLERQRRDLGWLREINRFLANIIQLLGDSNTRTMRRVNELETRYRDVRNISDEVQQQNAMLQLDHNSMQRELIRCHVELEDERKDKQMYQLRWEELKTVEEQIQAEKQQLLTDKQQLLTDKQQLLTDNQQLMTDNQQLLTEKQRLLTDNHQLLTDKQQLLTDRHHLLTDNQQLLTDNQQILTYEQAVQTTDFSLFLLLLLLLLAFLFILLFKF